jgi:hypothetical protein
MLYAQAMPANNPNGNPNLRPFNSETASAAGKKSAATRRARKVAMDLHQRGDITRATRTVQQWIDTYERDRLGEVAAATAQHCMMLVLNGEVQLDGRALAQLMETATTIARLEEGLHTSATIHATLSTDDTIERIRALRAQANRSTLEVVNDTRPVVVTGSGLPEVGTSNTPTTE